MRYFLFKRIFDIFFSFTGLVISLPFIAIFSFLIFLEDKSSPFYLSSRVAKDNKNFLLFKLRSMRVQKNCLNASKNDSTALDDPRLTRVGKILRKYKLDELPQLFNVLKGDLSFVGPRPNVRRETELYSEEENLLLSVKPGITDFSSIVFSDLEEILAGAEEVNIKYNQLVRPWKSRLGLFYIEQKSFLLDIKLIILTLLNPFRRQQVLDYTSLVLKELNASSSLIKISKRSSPLVPAVPPGFTEVVKSRKLA